MDAREKRILGLEDVPVADRTCDDELVYLRPFGGRVMEHGNNRLVVKVDGYGIDWALLRWVSGPSEPGKEPEQYQVEMHGCGVTSKYLREARHTYFGEKGYIYYVNPALLAWAFGCLREWFDFDGEDRS